MGGVLVNVHISPLGQFNRKCHSGWTLSIIVKVIHHIILKKSTFWSVYCTLTRAIIFAEKQNQVALKYTCTCSIPMLHVYY